ncbi:AI-2E family transporter [Sulfitobacter sp. CS16]|uniref:AI-2E family transporter n=1 Tax=Sulfitobacter sp. CS16 TaxID=3368573 RepID=UPI0037453CAE
MSEIDPPVSLRPVIWPQVTLAVLALVAAVVLGRTFIMPVFLAFLLALTFSPIRRFLQRRRVPPPVSALLFVSALAVGFGALALVLSGPIQQYVADRETIAADVERKLRGVSEVIEKVAEASDEVQEVAEGGQSDAETAAPSDEEPQEVVVQGPSVLSQTLTTAPSVMGQIIFTLVLFFFLTASGDMFHEKLVQTASTFKDKKRAIQISHDIERKLSRYFLTITVINAGLGVSVGLALWGLGMPNPLLFGVLAFALNYIPFLGAIAGVLLAFFIAVISFDTLSSALFVAGVYLGLTTIEGQFITPYAVGRSLKLNPVLVFIAVAFWGWAWSVIGMFIAVPALIVLRVFSDKIPALEGLGIFLSGSETTHEQRVSKEKRDAEQAEI